MGALDANHVVSLKDNDERTKLLETLRQWIPFLDTTMDNSVDFTVLVGIVLLFLLVMSFSDDDDNDGGGGCRGYPVPIAPRDGNDRDIYDGKKRSSYGHRPVAISPTSFPPSLGFFRRGSFCSRRRLPFPTSPSVDVTVPRGLSFSR